MQKPLLLLGKYAQPTFLLFNFFVILSESEESHTRTIIKRNSCHPEFISGSKCRKPSPEFLTFAPAQVEIQPSHKERGY